ncbi:IS110 family transposase [Methylocystis rosea]|uniref:Uncharacterized protein n=1 Tax=Methylocystis rosea TaxID=173366 RepID=A0A3G8MA94_9HYPH|nr:transposase [Methylocystis rosea]AZG78082.1 hypothetical protein EHO51_15810 [Methylocystis rosea]
MANRRAGEERCVRANRPHHRALERAFGAAGVPIAKVNPRQARRFAEAAGKLVKADRVDAAMLARMGEVLGLEPRPFDSQTIAELKELHLVPRSSKTAPPPKIAPRRSRLPCSKSRTKSAS